MILVGEMRDLETISTALTAAETGHLVFATLHTQDTAQTIDRIIDVFPPHQQDQVRVQLSVGAAGDHDPAAVPDLDGSGRVSACEVLVPTPAVRNLIREGKTHQIYSVMQTGSASACRRWTPRWPRSCAKARSRRKMAEHAPARRRSSATARRRALAGGRDSDQRHEHDTSSRPSTSRAARPSGEVEASPSRPVADQLKARGLIVLDIADKHGRADRTAFMQRVEGDRMAVFGAASCRR